MKCKNCGATVEKGSSICTNCGAVVNAESNYVLLHNEDKIYQDVYSKKKKKPLTRIMLLIISLAVIIGAGIVSYTFFYGVDIQKEQPELSFVGGSGIINDDEAVVYVTIDDSSKLEYIHSVKLYAGEVDAKTVKGQAPVVTDYQYTKNIENSFRAIFFDMEELNLDKEQNYTYTFEMTFSYYDNENHYTYYKPVNFKGSTKADASEIVFDHSMTTTLVAETTQKVNTDGSKNEAVAQTTEEALDITYIYENYWYTAPVKTGDVYTISAFKFNRDATFIVTDYYKNGNEDWQVSTSSGNVEIKNDIIYFSTADGEVDEFSLDLRKKTISHSNGDLTQRKFNSVKNAEDFFGI